MGKDARRLQKIELAKIARKKKERRYQLATKRCEKTVKRGWSSPVSTSPISEQEHYHGHQRSIPFEDSEGVELRPYPASWCVCALLKDSTDGGYSLMSSTGPYSQRQGRLADLHAAAQGEKGSISEYG